MKTTKINFSKLNKLSKAELEKLGFRQWDEPKDGKILMLFPYTLYKDIPNGFEVTDITYDKEKFKKGVSDDDRRFGCLAYGILIEV